MKNNFLLVIKVIVSAGLLYLIIRKMDWMQLTVCIRQAELFYLFIGVVIGLIFNGAKFVKWHYLINSGKYVHAFWDGARSYMLGNALGLVTPMRAGDLGRALYFSRENRTRIMGLTIIDRVMDLVAILILSIGGSFVLVKREFGLLILISCIFCILALYSPGFLHVTFKRTVKLRYLQAKLVKLIDVLKILNFRTITLCLVLSLIAFILTIVEFYYVVSAFENIALVSTSLVTPLITLSALIPVTFMGLGVREGLSIMLFSTFGISAGTALSAAFLCFVINNVTISLIGVFYLSKVELSLKKAGKPGLPMAPVGDKVKSFE